jgi:hypothetical protein
MADPKPTITFTVNLSNKESSSLPYSSDLVGNQAITEAVSQIEARSTWLPSLGNAGSKEPNQGSGANIVAKNGNTIVAHGLNALYLKRTYASGTANDLLTIINETW